MRKLLVFLIPSLLSAQVTSGTITGTAKDETGVSIPNANVTITYLPTSQKIVTRTNDDGRFTVANLKPGHPYVINVTSIGSCNNLL